MESKSKPFFKITFQDLEIAKEFFENKKHYTEWLFLVSEYYQGNILSSNIKIVQKYFTSYKKTIDFIISSKQEGKKGFLKRVENEANRRKTLDGYEKPTSSTPDAVLDANNKLLINNNKLLNINNKSKTKKAISDEISVVDLEFEFKNNSFNTFWRIYDKKLEVVRCEKLFMSLSVEKINRILEVVQEYVNSKPDKQFRKNPITWLSNESWNDEIIKNFTNGQQPQQTNAEIFHDAINSEIGRSFSYGKKDY